MVFPRFALVHTGVGIQGIKYSCGSHYMGKIFVACKTATTYGEDLNLEGGVVLYVQVFYYEMQCVTFPRHSLSGWGLQRQWRCGFCNLRRQGMYPRSLMRARVGSGYPPLPLHGAICWLVILFMSFANVTGDISACNERATNNMKKGGSVHMHIFIREYPSGPLSQRPTKGVPIWVSHVFVEPRAWTLVSKTHMDLSLRYTGKTHVPRVCLTVCVCVHVPILILGVYGCLLRGLSGASGSSKT